MRLTIIICFLSLSLFGQNNRNQFYYFTDFLNTPSTSTTTDDLMSTASGASSIVASFSNSSRANSVGVIACATGTSATGRAAITNQANALTFGGGEWDFEVRLDSIQALCDGTESYALLVGFFDTYTAANQTDGIYFLYDSIGTSTGSASSDRWQTVTASNGFRSFFETSTDVSINPVNLRIAVNADGTSVNFYIDGVSMRTETSTIPIGKTRKCGFGVMIIKSAGLTSRAVYLDYLEAICRFNQSR